jgi:hypothetical protein
MIGRMMHSACQVALALLGGTGVAWAGTVPAGDLPGHDYPTYARVEYVQECMLKNGTELAILYKCSCAIDRIAKDLAYDDFVDWATFARNASLAGERGGIFRDSDEARNKTKRYRELEAAAYKACGLPVHP